jgi:hypothetical protein
MVFALPLDNEGSGMTHYQFYFLNDCDRDVARQDYSCADDRAAIFIGRSLCFDHNIDIWHEARRVSRVQKSDFGLGFQPTLN